MLQDIVRENRIKLNKLQAMFDENPAEVAPEATPEQPVEEKETPAAE